MNRNLHIFIPSQLKVNGGGIETWIVYFLRNLSSMEKYNSIIVYGFESDAKSQTIVDLEFNKQVMFLLSPLSKKRNGALNILNFVRNHEVALKNNVREEDHLVIVGSVFLAPFFLKIRKLITERRLKTILWIRSKTIGEMKARKSKYVFWAKLFEKIMIKHSDLIITNGEDTLNYFKTMYRKYSQKMQTVFNAVNYKEYSGIEIENNSSLKETLKVTYLGRYIKAKGFDNFIESIQQLSSTSMQKKSIEFVSYGHGEMEKMIDNISLIDKGPYTQKELYNLLKENNVFVFLNKSENAGGLSHALLEVMAAGKIVIAWENEVHCQILNSRNSILIEEGNINELTKAYTILYKNLVEDGNHYNSLRENARKTAEKYSEENHIIEFLRLVER